MTLAQRACYTATTSHHASREHATAQISQLAQFPIILLIPSS
jgi:hypothetical protein